MLIENVKHISCIFISIFSFAQNKGAVTLPPNHVVEHPIVRTDIEDRKVLLEETAVAHFNPLWLWWKCFYLFTSDVIATRIRSVEKLK